MNLLVPSIHNPIALLREDHELVKDILKELDKTTERDKEQRERLFTELKTQLDVHAAIEESVFYPALKDTEKTHGLILEAYEEHGVVKDLLKELNIQTKNTEEWKAKFTVLKENVEHHIEEEENEIFKKAKEVLDNDELERLGVQMRTTKETKMAAAIAPRE